MKFIFYIIAFLFLAGCSSKNTTEQERKTVDTLSVQQLVIDTPQVEVRIALADTTLKAGDKILLDITLTNVGSTNQRLLFDKPVPSTRGPWRTLATVNDRKTNKTVLKYQNKSLLSSQIYTEEQLQAHYYNLGPNQSISKEYELSDIVVFNSADNKLPQGTYEIQLFYYNNFSNKLTVVIE